MNRGRIFIAAIIAIVGLVGYYGTRSKNEITGEVQHISLTEDQEIAMGMQSAPEMADQFGGVDRDPEAQRLVAEVGSRVVSRTAAGKTHYPFKFTLLADPKTINAFALPGGPVFITRALFDHLENEAQLAGVLGHEVGHVVGRHSAEHLAKSRLAGALVGAVGVAASDEQGRGQRAAMAAAFVAQMTDLRYGRKDELEADSLGVDFISQSGYDPRAMIRVMDILAKSGGRSSKPEFLSTHPDPGNRAGKIEDEITRKFPQGVPSDLSLGRKLAGRGNG